MTPDELGRLNNVNSILLIRGFFPYKGKKLDQTEHKQHDNMIALVKANSLSNIRLAIPEVTKLATSEEKESADATLQDEYLDDETFIEQVFLEDKSLKGKIEIDENILAEIDEIVSSDGFKEYM